MKQVVDNFTRFHPHPEQIILSSPDKEPDFIKPYFGLRLFPCMAYWYRLFTRNW